MSLYGKDYIALQYVKCFICALVFLFSFDAIGFAQNPVVTPAPMGTIQSGPVTIVRKSKNTITIQNERIFLVTKDTVIMNTEEIVLGLSQIPIPCEANIEYLFGKKKDPICLKIVVGQHKKRIKQKNKQPAL
jgi:hypothetical protein